MTTVSFTDLRRALAAFLDKAEEDCEEIIITRSKGRKAVIVGYDEYTSLKETAYLLSSEANRKHLTTSMKQIQNGETVTITI